MPDLSEGWAIIIAAGIGAFFTVFGMVLVQILNNCSNKQQRETDSKERFFYEVYPKRLAVYDEAIKKLEAIIESGQSLMKPSLLTNETARDRISQDKHLLNDLFTRIRMFGSAYTIVIFKNLLFKADDTLADIYKAGDYCGVIFGRWINTVRIILQDFIQAIREDAGSNFVDKTIRVYFPKTNDGLINRIKDKLFPSPVTKQIKGLDNLYEQIQEAMRQEKDAQTDDEH
jgi:hypothetical protein